MRYAITNAPYKSRYCVWSGFYYDYLTATEYPPRSNLSLVTGFWFLFDIQVELMIELVRGVWLFRVKAFNL
ncbi:MAG: hypothetical protein ACK4XH_13560 [Microcystis sp.]|uniref:hypothetical protein n=1 Tax=Microcystis TaxID=1125 RepID=UPI0002F4A0F2|nr:hypothetical protein [Microcystis aeruginosa]